MKLKRALALIMITVMSVSFAGCSASEKNGSENDEFAVSQETVNSDGTVGNAGFENGLDEYWGLECSGAGNVEAAETEDTSNLENSEDEESANSDASEDENSTDEESTSEEESAAEAYAGTHYLALESDGHYTANVYQKIEGLEPGYYYVTVYAKNSGDHNACYVYANGTDQEQTMTAVPVSDEWNVVTIRGVEVGEDGTVTIGVYADSNSGNYVYIDDITLTYENNQETKYPSLFGGAVSRLTWEEDMGAVYYDSEGNEGDAIEIMAENGMNFARLELYNSPGKGRGDGTYYCPEGYQDPDDILSLAKRAKDAGMTLQLSFFYTDYWSNDCIPYEWEEAIEGKTEEEAVDILEEKVYEFTKDYLLQMEAQGTLPEYVSLGNEMQGGILLPYGSYENMEYLARFLNAGYKAVKEVSEDIQVILHISCNADDMKWNGNGTGSWFFGLCEEYEINYDVIGTSFYPYWAETLTVDDLVDWCNLMIDKFDKDVIIMESGYNWCDSAESGLGGQLADNGAYEGIYDSSPEGQRDFLIELINGIKSVKDGRCLGDLYWDPLFVEQEGCGWALVEYSDEADKNVISNTTLFDDNHVALPAFDAYRFNAVGDTVSEDSVDYTTSENGIYPESAVLKYYYEGDGKPSVEFDNGESVQMEEFTVEDLGDDTGEVSGGNSDDAVGENSDADTDEGAEGVWYCASVSLSDGGFTICDSDGNELIAISNYENSDLYTKILKGYYTYLYNGELYYAADEAIVSYYIAGSTDEWDSSDSGVFSNYWATNDEWLDKLSENEDGTYSFTLEGAKPGYTYVYNVYKNKDMDDNVFSSHQQFTVDYECDLIVTIDVENETVSYKVSSH